MSSKSHHFSNMLQSIVSSTGWRLKSDQIASDNICMVYSNKWFFENHLFILICWWEIFNLEVIVLNPLENSYNTRNQSLEPKTCILVKETLKSDQNCRKCDIFWFWFFSHFSLFSHPFFSRKKRKTWTNFSRKILRKMEGLVYTWNWHEFGQPAVTKSLSQVKCSVPRLDIDDCN